MSIRDHWPESAEFIREFLAERDRGSDRALVLVSASMLDILVGRLLMAFFTDGTSEKELMEGTAPLATFSSRIRVALALGLLTAVEAKALHTIRDVRNAMAHKLGVKLSANSLAAKISHTYEQMFTKAPDASASARDNFAIVANGMIAGLISQIKDVEQRKAASKGYGT